MSFATARRDLEKRMADNWATTEIAYDNVDFTTPEDQSWVAFRIFEEDTNRINVGMPGHHRVTGNIIIEINVPVNTGTHIARGYADDIAGIFREAQFNGITMREAKVTNAGIVNGWYRVDVLIPFYWTGIYS